MTIVLTYADIDTVTSLTEGLEDGTNEIPDTILNIAISHSDSLINNQLIESGITEPINPDELTEPGNLFAAVFLYDQYNTNNETRSPTAIAWETQANTMIKNYLAKYPTEEDPNIPIITATSFNIS